MKAQAAPFVICIGEAMIELSLNSETPGFAQIGVAGDTLNTAIYLKRCLPEGRVAYLTKLGAGDPHSAQIMAAMADEDLETELVLKSPDRIPGLYAIATDKTGERSFTYWRDASAARDLMQAPGLSLQMLEGADLVYLSAITLAILTSGDRAALMSILKAYRAQGGRVAFDSNYRPRLWPDQETARDAITEAWANCDLALPSMDDEQAVFGAETAADIRARLVQAGVKQGALKRGDKGPMSLTGKTLSNLEPVTHVVDTTSAGDSFNGAYLAAYLRGASEVDCMAAGHRLASRVIGARGAILPRKDMP